MSTTETMPDTDLDRSVAGAFARCKDVSETLDLVRTALIELGDSKLGRTLHDYLDSVQAPAAAAEVDPRNEPGGAKAYDDMHAAIDEPAEAGAPIEQQVGNQYQREQGDGAAPAKPEGSTPTKKDKS